MVECIFPRIRAKIDIHSAGVVRRGDKGELEDIRVGDEVLEGGDNERDV